MTKFFLMMYCSGFLLFGQQGQPSGTIPGLLPLAEDLVPIHVRDARGALYDRSLSIFDSQPFGAPQPITMITLEQFEEMPVSQSDAVLVGEVVKSQPFLSKKRTGLYTEYTVKASNKVKSEDKKADQDTFVVLRWGGTVRLNDGRVVNDEVRGDGDPFVVGKKYLIFLQYRVDVDAYFPLTIWNILDNGLIQAAFPSDKARVATKESRYDGLLIDRVIDTLKGRSDLINEFCLNESGLSFNFVGVSGVGYFVMEVNRRIPTPMPAGTWAIVQVTLRQIDKNGESVADGFRMTDAFHYLSNVIVESPAYL